MSSREDMKLARFLKVVLDFLLGLMLFSCVSLLVWIATSSFIMRQTGIKATASIPVIIGSGEEQRSEVTFSGEPKDNIGDAYLAETEGKLRLETNSPWLVVITNAAKLPDMIGLTYVVYLLRAIVKTNLSGEPFAAENGRRVRRMGYTVLLFSFLGPFVQKLAAYEILNRLPSMMPTLEAGPTFNSGSLGIAIFILLLANIWSHGLELERDRALTI